MFACRSLSTRLVVVAAVSAIVLLPAAATERAWADARQGAYSASATSVSAGFSPLVRHTGRPPTGYSVTFRYQDPRATSVQIKGQWYFSNPAQTTADSSQGVLPPEWVPGDIPIAYPNDTAPNWPVSSMTKDPRSGVWSYTTPLPSGLFIYGLFVNCTDPAQSGCREIADPSNPPWNSHNGVTSGSVESVSVVYVPADPAYATVDYAWQAPRRAHGALREVSYTSPASHSPRGLHPLAIYTPPSYNPRRAAPYPTLYLSHGYGGNELGWSTEGAAANILDNLIATGQVLPMVVVMTDFNGFAGDCLSDREPWVSAYDHDLLNNVIPYVQAHYHVASQVSQRAFAGLSCGGGLANSLLIDHTGAFGYYAVMSPYPGIAALSSAHVAALRQVGVLVGCGRQDPIASNATSEVTTLRGAGVGVFADFINGGHEWYVWRILLRDFLTRVAFLPVLA
jgi:enterochelin esterase-like enzyme